MKMLVLRTTAEPWRWGARWTFEGDGWGELSSKHFPMFSLPAVRRVAFTTVGLWMTPLGPIWIDSKDPEIWLFRNYVREV